MQLNMFGGVTPTPSSGGDVAFAEEGFAGKKHDEKEIEERLKRLRQEDEDILIILSQFITSNNSN